MNKVVVIERAHMRFCGGYQLYDIFNIDNKLFAKHEVNRLNKSDNATYKYRLRIKSVK